MEEETLKGCNHHGKWGSLGVTAINAQKGVIIVHNLFCKNCGATKTNTVNIAINSPISIPNIKGFKN